ncbi:twin-arginine translocase TatA/TatE family subunit [Paenibacillus sp. TAB 01]|uniref:twin-arginine translocase TatA/TatE family subunit n=1 Tax=Paenibacillus sp. TAB 01 TaxID=3368988 RepID=UPI0037510813
MFGNLGFTEILLIAIVALVIFGPNKLPELGRAMGKTIREFKKGASDLMEDVRTPPEERKDVTPASGAGVDAGASAAQAQPAASAEPIAPAAQAVSAAGTEPEPVQERPKPAADPRRLPE